MMRMKIKMDDEDEELYATQSNDFVIIPSNSKII